ncbi:P-loop containing nucleoside triphosphate hydrolase protein [Scleroderma yunnanense]
MSAVHSSAFSTPTSFSEMDSSDGVGLSDPVTAQRRRAMLDLVNRLRNTGIQREIDLPMIAVIGNQSAGKSSLIESISGITLPRASGTCTRCPTECKLTRSDLPWSCTVKLHFHTDIRGTAIKPNIVNFGDAISDKAEVEERIRCAQRAILNPSTNPTIFLSGAIVAENETSFSRNYISLEISGRELEDLSFVDLPGLIASVGQHGNVNDIELVKNLVISYIEKPSCVILLTVACETDFENQGAHHLAKQYDPEGRRTVGVLTKPDRIPQGEEESWIRLIRNEREPLANNWYCVKQPSSHDLSLGITWAGARHQEEEWFSTKEPWSSLDSYYKSFLCTSKLTERLSNILAELISKRLPEIQEELYKVLQQTEKEIAKLPQPPSGNPLGEILRVLDNFKKEVSERVEGTPDADGLLQTIRPHTTDFKLKIRETAPNFVPWERRVAHQHHVPQTTFFSDEESDSGIEDEGRDEIGAVRYAAAAMPAAPSFACESYDVPHPTVGAARECFESIYADADEGQQSADFISPVVSEPQAPGPAIPTGRKTRVTICIDEVMQRAQMARTRELPDHYPFVVQKTYIIEFVKNWRQPALALFDAVYNILKKDVERIVDRHFARMGRGGLKQSVLMIMYDHLDAAAARSKDKIEWLLQLESSPATLNTHYYFDYKNKVYAYYRAHRRSEKLAQNMSQRSQDVNNVISALAQLGISARREDLSKLLPSDPMEAALSIMASVRAYFQAIDNEAVRGLERNLEQVLRDGLQLTGIDAHERCAAMLEEFPAVVARRSELTRKLERLKAAKVELRQHSI